MMIHPEGYYEMELKGKSAEEIARKIRGLKNEIGHLKKVIESPDRSVKSTIFPNESTRLRCTRLYLERAVAAYEEVGGTYRPGKAEQRAAAFDAAIPSITRIVFSIGGFFGGYETRTITLTDDQLLLDVDHSQIPKPSNFNIEPDSLMTKDEFLEGLRNIHIGEWKSHYINRNIMDGTQWELSIEYADGRKAAYAGSNAFPYNFDEFCELIGYQEETEDAEDDE